MSLGTIYSRSQEFAEEQAALAKAAGKQKGGRPPEQLALEWRAAAGADGKVLLDEFGKVMSATHVEFERGD